MRVFEVTLTKDRTPKQTTLHWPEWWGDVAPRVDVVAYQDDGLETEGAICVCDNSTWDEIAAHNDKAIAELDEATANAKGRVWRPQIEKITDERAVIGVVAKSVRGEKLSKDDLAVIDPEDSTPGIAKSPLFDVRRIAVDRGDVLDSMGVAPL